MDAVFFNVKAAHLASQRAVRRMLRAVGLTPARFDLLHALGRDGMRQSDLWKRLNVVRSVVSEMLRSLLAIGWIERARAVDTRTWLVRLTQKGRALYERAYDEWVDSGNVAVHVDAALCEGHVQLNADRKRLEIIYACKTLDAAFRGMPWCHAPSLYFWDPEDYYFCFTDSDERFGDVPFADELSRSLDA